MWIGLYVAPEQLPGSLEALAQTALQFTPHVTIEAPDVLLLDVGASLQLFGGPKQLLQRLRAECMIAGVATVRLATAPNPTAAALLARVTNQDQRADTPAQRQAQLNALPVTGLCAAQPHRELLQTLGTHTLRDLALLPRIGVARRFGRALLDELDRAMGRAIDVRIPYQPAPVFVARLELPSQVTESPALLFGARRLLGQLAGWLNAGRLGTRRLTFSAEHDDCPPTPVEVRLATPSRDPDRLCALLRERLGRIQLPEAAHTLGLTCNDATPLADATVDLFATTPPEHESLGRLIERLHARLGPGGLWRVSPYPDHRPEAAYRVEWVDDLTRLTPKAASPTRVTRPSRPTGLTGTTGSTRASRATRATGSVTLDRPPGLPRPLWLLHTPLALTERNTRPFWHGPLALVAGPERIETGWWDGNLVERDYFVAQNDEHELVWIFRSRTGRSNHGPGPGTWYLHGLFG
jgi:protein ImuB